MKVTWVTWIVTFIVTRKVTIIGITTTHHTLANLRSDLQQEQQSGEASMIQNPKPVTCNSISVSSLLILYIFCNSISVSSVIYEYFAAHNLDNLELLLLLSP